VGCKIKAEYSPVRDDGVKGDPETAISDLVQGGITAFVGITNINS
jgi:hypothetical protein